MTGTIEVLNKSDIASYKALIDNCFGGSNPLEQYQKYQQREEYTIWVVKEKDTIIASVTQYAIDLFTFNFQPCLMLFNVAVLEQYRKKGIGKQMLSFVIQKAKEDGYRQISLTCLDSAAPAHGLYESVGFRKADSRKYVLDLV